MQNILQQAIALYQQGEFTNALSLLQEYNQLPKNLSSVSLQLEAICFANVGDFETALIQIVKAIPLAVNPQEKRQAINISNQFKLALKQQNRSREHLSNVVCKTQFLGSGENVISITQQLVNYLVNHGAKFDKGITFVENNGVLSITSTVTGNQVHMQVPLSCMPMLGDYQFSVTEDNIFEAVPKANLLNAKAVPVMELMVKLFNATDKLTLWQKVYPFFVYKAAPKLIDKLFTFRPQSKKLARYYDYFKRCDWQQLLIESFLGSREFTYQKNHLLAANIHSPHDSEKGLLAIIDFLNHRISDGGYVVNTQSAAMEIVGTPDELTNELFVQYGLIDPFLSYFIYGFVDTSAPFIYSGKCEIELLSGDKFVVLSMSGGIKRATLLPERLSHLSDYLPPGIKKQGNVIVVSDIRFPNKSEFTLLIETIEEILITAGTAEKYHSKKALREEVAHIVDELVGVNVDFWRNFKSDLEYLACNKQDLVSLCDYTIKELSELARY